MKKIMFFFILWIVMVNPIRALENTYYSEYGEYGEFTTNEAISDNLSDVVVERRYLYYKENKILGNYYMNGANPETYPFKDESDVITETSGEWSKIIPEVLDGRLIETKTVYEYSDMKEIRYIHFYNLSGSYGAFRISELLVFNGLSKLYYDISSCHQCSVYFNFINNNIINENMSVVYNGGSFTIDLGNYYNINQLNLKLYIYDVGTDPETYTVAFSRDGTNHYAYAEFVTNIKDNDYNNVQATTFDHGYLAYANPEYYDWVTSADQEAYTFTHRVRIHDEYMYTDTLYRYYDIKREYSEEYMSMPNETYPMIDLKEYQDYYKVRTRDQLTINDAIVIDDNHNLESYIISSSQAVVVNDIDYSTNGNYIAEFKVGSLVVNLPVVVNLTANVVTEPIIEEPVVEDAVVDDIVIEKPVIEKPIIKPIVKKEEKSNDEKPITEATKEQVALKSVVKTANSNIKVNDYVYYWAIFLFILTVISYIYLKTRKQNMI